MRRHKETEITSPAMIRGFGAVPDTPLRLRVSRVVARGRNIIELSVPFYAFVDYVDHICGTKGVMLRCGVMVPWARLENHQQLVIVRQPIGRMSGLPMVVLNSLVRPDLRSIR